MQNERRSLWLAWGLWFYFWLLILTLVFGLLMIYVSFLDRRGLMIQRVGHFWGRSLLWLARIRVQVEGLEHLDPAATYVYAANHRSQFDIFVLMAVLPGQFRWVAKKSLFQIPIFGQALSRMGCIPIDRDNLMEAMRSLTRATDKVRRGLSMIIFPEGTRATSRELLPFKKGVFIMALKAEQPVVPVSISGTLRVQPPRSLMIRPGPVKVVVSPPLSPKAFKRKEDLIAAVRQAIATHYDPDFPDN